MICCSELIIWCEIEFRATVGFLFLGQGDGWFYAINTVDEKLLRTDRTDNLATCVRVSCFMFQRGCEVPEVYDVILADVLMVFGLTGAFFGR